MIIKIKIQLQSKLQRQKQNQGRKTLIRGTNQSGFGKSERSCDRQPSQAKAALMTTKRTNSQPIPGAKWMPKVRKIGAHSKTAFKSRRRNPSETRNERAVVDHEGGEEDSGTPQPMGLSKNRPVSWAVRLTAGGRIRN